MSDKKYVIGLDYGTDSARAVIVNALNGDEVASSVKYYPRWAAGKYCDASKDQYRQHPLDYIEAMEYTVKEALSLAGPEVAKSVVGISFDTTGSTPVFVNEEGVPLSLTPGFEEDPDAMFVLWKDHTSVKEAAEINLLAKKWAIDYTQYEGGIYSSEWVWAKMLHVLRTNGNVKMAAYSWVEHCDWMPALLTGNTRPSEVKRSRCAAGHKAMWSGSWGGLPSEEFLTSLDPVLQGYRGKLYNETYTCDIKAGQITPEWAEQLGLPASVAVGVSAFDAHIGAVGGGVQPDVLVRIIGTSTCDIMVASPNQIGNKLIPGICGQVDGSVVPGYIGLEAGQSAFGDVYAWFKNVVAWPIENILAKTSIIDAETRERLITEVMDQIIPELTAEAIKIPIEESTIIALDWMNGRRTPDANLEVNGIIAGLKLGSSAPRIFRALVEATAFGSKAIADRFAREGVETKEIIGLGGVAKKSAFVMQTMADVLNRPIKITRTEQTCAVGAAMFAAVVGGIYAKVEDAQKAMDKGFETEYLPNPVNAEKYAQIYQKYLDLGEFIEKKL
jgi:L-ribulokinase